MRKVVVLLFITALVSCSDNTKKEYYAGGKVKTEITIVDGKKNGPAKAYYESGELKREGTYVNDSLEGNVITYFINGQKETETNYIGGKKTGLYKEYYEDGQLKTEANLKDDNQDGLTKHYFETGKLKSEEYYKEGIEDGKMIFYYTDGKLKMDAIMEKGVTIYFQKYDSLGNAGEEHREVKAEITSKTIKLGETFTAKLKLTGPTKGVLIDIFRGEAESVSQIKTMSPGQLKEEKAEFNYTYTPKKKGAYVFRIWFMLRDKNGQNQHQYTYENTFVCE